MNNGLPSPIPYLLVEIEKALYQKKMASFVVIKEESGALGNLLSLQILWSFAGLAPENGISPYI